ncbi:hypothetical protein [Bdellovibrio bacteriovorus]|nr:hypothetical protein [Bdellovibrio bacteriovorus]
MKQLNSHLNNSLKLKARDFLERTILALGATALIAIATDAHALVRLL